MFKEMETKAVSKDVIFCLLDNSFRMSLSSLQSWKVGAIQSGGNVLWENTVVLNDDSLNVRLSNKNRYTIFHS